MTRCQVVFQRDSWHISYRVWKREAGSFSGHRLIQPNSMLSSSLVSFFFLVAIDG